MVEETRTQLSRGKKLARFASIVLGVVFLFGIILWFSGRGASFAFIEEFGGVRWRSPYEEDPLMPSLSRQPNAIFVFRTDPAIVRQRADKELRERGWFNLNDTTKSRAIGIPATFARVQEYEDKDQSWDDDSSDWVSIGSQQDTSWGVTYPEGTSCVVTIYIEPTWIEKYAQSFRAKLSALGR